MKLRKKEKGADAEDITSYAQVLQNNNGNIKCPRPDRPRGETGRRPLHLQNPGIAGSMAEPNFALD